MINLPTLEDLETGEISVCKSCKSQMVDDGYCEECKEATDFINKPVYFVEDVKSMLKAHAAAHQKDAETWKEGTRIEQMALAARDAVLKIAGLTTEDIEEQ